MSAPATDKLAAKLASVQDKINTLYAVKDAIVKTMIAAGRQVAAAEGEPALAGFQRPDYDGD